MRIFGLASVKEKTKSLKVENYQDITLKSVGVYYRSGRLRKVSFGLSPVKTFLSQGVSDGYCFSDGYALFKNGYLCDINGKKLVLSPFNNPPFIAEFEKNGEKATVAIENGVGYYFGKFHGNLLLPKGEKYIFYEGKAFTFVKNKLLFCKIDESTKNGYIVLPVSVGDIVDIVNYDEGLYALCKNGIVKVASQSKDGFSIDIKAKGNFNAQKNSAREVRDKLVFIADRKLYSYSDGKVIKEDSLLDMGEYAFLEKSDAKDGKYIACVKDGANEYFFVKDLVTGEDTFMEKGNKILSGNGEFTDISSGKIYRFSSSGFSAYRFESKTQVFDEIKTVCGIKLYSATVGVMKIKSDLSENSFKLKAGENSFRTNIKSKRLSFSFEFTDGDFSVSEQIINYRD